MDGSEFSVAAAANMAGWHDASVRALGARTEFRDGLWLAVDPTAPIYFDAIVIDPASTGRSLESALGDPDRFVGLSEPFGIDLVPFGFQRGEDQAWFVREPGPLPPSTPPPGFRVQLAANAPDLASWEAASVEGFRGRGEPVVRHSVYGPPILMDPRMRVWMGRIDERVVSGTMTFVEAGVAGIYSTSTIPDARRRGYARALALGSLADLGATRLVVQPSAESEPLYRYLGFEPFATFATWFREPRQPRAAST